jgi:hypothetical protein
MTNHYYLGVDTAKEQLPKKTRKILNNWLKNFWKAGIGDTIIELWTQATQDFIVYGYSPWDYAEELKLDLKYQGYI